jgi:hypothetical protein
LNRWLMNSGQALNCNRIHSGQVFNHSLILLPRKLF